MPLKNTVKYTAQLLALLLLTTVMAACSPPKKENNSAAAAAAGNSSNALCRNNATCAQQCATNFPANQTAYNNCMNGTVGTVKPGADGNLFATGSIISSCDDQGDCTFFSVE